MTGERTDAAVGEPRVAEPTPGHPFDELRTPPFIRPYRRDDRDAVFEICLRTAAGGGDATGVYSDDALMPEVFALPYVEYDPGLAFVVDDGYGRALGYIIGVADTRAFVDWWGREWGPAFRTMPRTTRRPRRRACWPRTSSRRASRWRRPFRRSSRRGVRTPSPPTVASARNLHAGEAAGIGEPPYR